MNSIYAGTKNHKADSRSYCKAAKWDKSEVYMGQKVGGRREGGWGGGLNPHLLKNGPLYSPHPQLPLYEDFPLTSNYK